VLAYFDTAGVSNGGTEAINLIIEKSAGSPTASATSPITGYGSCSPPMASDPTDADPPMLKSEDPRKGIVVLGCGRPMWKPHDASGDRRSHGHVISAQTPASRARTTSKYQGHCPSRSSREPPAGLRDR